MKTTKPQKSESVRLPKKFRENYTRTQFISAQSKIDEGPFQIKDEPFLVKIVIGGSEMYVSPWSIRDGVYHPGLDSEFLVHRYSPSANQRKR